MKKTIIIIVLTAFLISSFTLSLCAIEGEVHDTDNSAHLYSTNLGPAYQFPGYGNSIVRLKCHLYVYDYSVSSRGYYDWYYRNPDTQPYAATAALKIQSKVKSTAEFSSGVPEIRTVINNMPGQDLPMYTGYTTVQTDPLVIKGKSTITTTLFDAGTNSVIITGAQTHIVQ